MRKNKTLKTSKPSTFGSARTNMETSDIPHVSSRLESPRLYKELLSRTVQTSCPIPPPTRNLHFPF